MIFDPADGVQHVGGRKGAGNVGDRQTVRPQPGRINVDAIFLDCAPLDIDFCNSAYSGKHWPQLVFGQVSKLRERTEP